MQSATPGAAALASPNRAVKGRLPRLYNTARVSTRGIKRVLGERHDMRSLPLNKQPASQPASQPVLRSVLSTQPLMQLTLEMPIKSQY
ncbi:hypothetical protein E2C01_083616 [Portunus trituberculatus]|uniref:Uncharacterized protein n=1 Tax=Portunus trituberculatus TaxID=210409 RepID=A0A5B7J5C6_PORTR|nr:hypothetical protein [Portunus trituberculatus]